MKVPQLFKALGYTSKSYKEMTAFIFGQPQQSTQSLAAERKRLGRVQRSLSLTESRFARRSDLKPRGQKARHS